MTSQPHVSVPGLEVDQATSLEHCLQKRLVSLLDLQLTLKHVHWNLVGPNFLSVHQMLDDQAGPVRNMTDEIAERIRVLGGAPKGTPSVIVEHRRWGDYPLDVESVFVHLKEMDAVYSGIIADHRVAIAEVGPVDRVTEDLLIRQTAALEKFQWLMRSFFERSPESTEHGHVSSAIHAAERREASTHGGADRAPTAEEEAAAADAARDVDVDSAGSHFEEMAETGARVKGEGKI